MFIEEYFEKNFDSCFKHNCIIDKKFSVSLIKKCIERIDRDRICFENDCSFPTYFFKKYNLDLEIMSRIENIPLSFIEENVEHIDWDYLCSNKTIPLSFFEKYIEKLPLLNFKNLSFRKDLNVSFIEKFPQFLESHAIFENVYDFTPSFLERNDIFPHINWHYLFENEHVEISFFEKYISKIESKILTKIEHLPFWFVKKYKNKFKNGIIFSHSEITISFIMKNFSRINWSYLSQNESLPLSFFEKYTEKCDWEKILLRSDLTFEFCEKYKEYLSPYFGAWNENIPLSFLIKNPEMIQLGHLFCFNPKITISFLEKFGKKYHYKELIFNFPFEYQFFLENKIHSFSLLKNDF